MVKTVKFLGNNGGRVDMGIIEKLSDKENLSISIAVKKQSLATLREAFQEMRHTQAKRLVTLRMQQVERELHELYTEYQETL